MGRFFVPVYGTPNKKCSVESDATVGATVGVNLLDQDGNVIPLNDILNSAATTGVPASTPTITNQPTASTDYVPEGATNKYLTAKAVQTTVGAALYGVSTGTNTYAVSLSPALTSYTTGLVLAVKFPNANSGASTIDVSGLGAKAIQSKGSALTGAELAANSTMLIVYDGTHFQIAGSVGGGGSIPYGVAAGTNTYTATLGLSAYTTGELVVVRFTNQNTGASTFNSDSLGAVAIQLDGAALVAGDIPAASTLALAYDGSVFQIIGEPPGGGGGAVAGMPCWIGPSGFNTVDTGYQGYSIFSCCYGAAINCAASTFTIKLAVVTTGATVVVDNCVVARCLRGTVAVVDFTNITFGGGTAPFTIAVTGGSVDAISDTVNLTIDPAYDYYFIVYFDPTQLAGINPALNNQGLWATVPGLSISSPTQGSFWSSGYFIGDHTADNPIPLGSLHGVAGVLCFHDVLVVS